MFPHQGPVNKQYHIPDAATTFQKHSIVDPASAMLPMGASAPSAVSVTDDTLATVKTTPRAITPIQSCPEFLANFCTYECVHRAALSYAFGTT